MKKQIITFCEDITLDRNNLNKNIIAAYNQGKYEESLYYLKMRRNLYGTQKNAKLK